MAGSTQRAAADPRKPDRLARHILWGLLAGVSLGLLARGLVAWQPAADRAVFWLTHQLLHPLGQVFLHLLFFVVVPLIFASLALGVVQLQRLERLGALAGRTFALFGLNLGVGVALGLLMMNLLRPGDRIDELTRAQLVQQYGGNLPTLQAAAAAQAGLSLKSLVDLLLPRNLLKSIVDFQLLPLILFALLVGAAATQLPPTHRLKVQVSLEIVTAIMTRLVHYALRLAPWAVAALVASVIILAGTSVLPPLLLFVVGVLGVLGLHLFGTLSLLLKLFSTRRPVAFFRAIRTVLVTAFSTSSSNATLPTAIQVCREKLGVSPATAGFVLPLGATMNMSGTALYEGCVVLFVAQAYGLPLGLGAQVTLLLLAVLSSVAVAGIPGASLPLIVGLLAGFGLPPEGIALIIGFDRLLDMARSVVNVAADLVTACVVDERLQPRGRSQDAREWVDEASQFPAEPVAGPEDQR